jgi:hypothetical protein
LSQACFKLLPYAGGVIFLLLVIFAIYVRNIPPKAPKSKINPAMTPEDTERFLQEAMKEGNFKMTPVTTKEEGEGGNAQAPDLADIMGEETTTTTTATTEETNNEDHVEL